MEIKDFDQRKHDDLWILSANHKKVFLGDAIECGEYALSHYSLTKEQFNYLTFRGWVDSSDGVRLDGDPFAEYLFGNAPETEVMVWSLLDRIALLEQRVALYKKRSEVAAAAVSSRAILGQEKRGV